MDLTQPAAHVRERDREGLPAALGRERTRAGEGQLWGTALEGGFGRGGRRSRGRLGRRGREGRSEERGDDDEGGQGDWRAL